MARSFPSAHQLVFFDIETGGPLKNRSGRFSIPDFFKSTLDTSPAWKKTVYGSIHANNPLLQLYASNIPWFEQNAAPPFNAPPLNTYIKPPAYPWIVEDGERVSLGVSEWARAHNLVHPGAVQTEEEALGHFFGGLETKVSQEGRVSLAGWNVGYDLGGVERAARRYDSLSRYHGWMGRMYEAGKLDVVEASNAMFQTVLAYSRTRPEFAARYLRTPEGTIARTTDELRRIPGWRLGNVGAIVGGLETSKLNADDLHAAFNDTRLTADVYQKWADAFSAVQEGGTDFDVILHEAGLLERSQTADKVFNRIYRAGSQLDRYLDSAVDLEKPLVNAVNWRRVGLAGAAVAAAGVAAGLAFGKRRNRQTQITGLSDDGIASDNRHRLTPFGSGWRGLEEQDSIKWQQVALLGAGYGAYRTAMGAYPKGTHGFIRGIERLTETKRGHNILNVFGASHWSAGYVPDELVIPSRDVYAEGKLVQHGVLDKSGDLNEFGKHIERLLGGDAGLASRAAAGPVRFQRESSWSPYLTLEGTDYQVRFSGVDAQHRGSRWASASSRWKRPLEEIPQYPPRPAAGSILDRWKDWSRQRRSARMPKSVDYGVFEGDLKFQPLFGRRKNAWFEALKQKAQIISLEMAERPQRLFARVGLGAKVGEWNSALSLGGKLLGTAAGIGAAAVALDYADYLTDHRLFGSIAGIVPKAKIARAELTDRVPGARATTDWYAEHAPGPQYGPVMFPLIGWSLGKLAGKAADLSNLHVSLEALQEGKPFLSSLMNPEFTANWGKIGLAAGVAAMLPFVPGLLGSRKTAGELRDEYSGKTPVAIRSGRWWELGNTPWSGRRIAMYRPNWYARLTHRPERVALWGSEKEYWAHSPLLHPLRWLRNPYQLEERNYYDRPYPMTSPALSNVPLIGPILSATVGRLLKPPKRMHEEEWDGTDYTLFSPRVEPRGPDALAASIPKEEFRSMAEIVRREGEIAAEFIGAPGWAAKTVKGRLFNDKKFGQEVYFEGSRQMTSIARRYYDQEAGAGFGPTPDMEGTETYSEAFRRFVQRDMKTLQANEIPNTMPHWLPGENRMVNFRTGDPYRKVASGASRLPGPGYEVLHPELKDVAYDQYPLIEQFRILSDVAPWSAEWFQRKSMLDSRTLENTESRIEYEQILARAEELKKSSEQYTERRFSGKTEDIRGTVKSAGHSGIELEELPGRTFRLSALGMSAADLSATVLREQNSLTSSQVASEVENRQRRLAERFASLVGSQVRLVVPEGTQEHSLSSRAVVYEGGRNVNLELTDQGLAKLDPDDAGAEYRELSGPGGRAMGRLAEAAAFEGDASALNPMHWVADPSHSKLWQERTALEQYKHHEVYGRRMQRWEHPIQSFINPWGRGLVYRMTGKVIVPKGVEENRDLDTLTDYLEYLRSLNPYTNNRSRTAVGANRFGEPAYLKPTLPGRDRYYFDSFLAEADDRKRREVLDTVSPSLAQILQAQWVKRDLAVAHKEGRPTPEVAEGGRLRTRKEYASYEQAKEEGETRLNYGDWQRSKEIAEFFFRRNVRLPENFDSPVYDPNLDYEDVKAKIVQMEGMDLHDFNIFDDRAALLWRKPYVDGAVRELTTGNDHSSDELRRLVEQMITSKANPSPDVRLVSQPSRRDRTNIKVTVKHDADEEILDDVRHHREEYTIQ